MDARAGAAASDLAQVQYEQYFFSFCCCLSHVFLVFIPLFLYCFWCVYFHWAVFLPSICVQCHKNKKPNPNKINATIFSNSDRCVSSPSATPNPPPGSGTERERRKLAANRSHNSPVHQRYVEVDCLVMSCVPQWAQWAWQVWHVHARASLDRWTPDAGGQDALGADLHRWEKQRLTWVLA